MLLEMNLHFIHLFETEEIHNHTRIFTEINIKN